MNDPTLKRFVIAVLDDQEGIPSAAYYLLLELVAEVGSPRLQDELRDILAKVKAQDDRWFLPEDWND